MARRQAETPRERTIREIREAIKAGTSAGDVDVPGKLDLSGDTSLKTLPAGLSAGWLDLTGCTGLERLPRDLSVRRLTLSGPWNPAHLLAGLRCHQLDLLGTTIEDFPAGVTV